MITTRGNTPAITISWPKVMRSSIVKVCWIEVSVRENSRLKPEMTLLVIPANRATATMVTIQSATTRIESASEQTDSSTQPGAD